jgi:hypothetical protein
MSGDTKHDWDVAPTDHVDPAGHLPVAGIDIRLDDVGGFARVLNGEVERNLGPHAATLARQCDDEAVNFGYRGTTPAVYEMRTRYNESLAQTLANLHSYVNATQILVAAAEKIISGYGSADGLSGAAANKILADAMSVVSSQPSATNAEVALQYVSDVPDAFTPWDAPR